jgi:hypothetical protein
MKAKVTNKGDFERCPPGMWRGVCAALIDLGTHWNSFKGQAEKKVRRIAYVFELEAEGKDGNDKRFFLEKDFNVAIKEDGSLWLGKLSNLHAMLQTWRGKEFADREDIDFNAIVGQPCQVNVIAKESGDRTFPTIDSVSRLGKGMQPLQASHPKLIYELPDDGSDPLPAPTQDWLPRIFGKTVEEILSTSIEWGGDGKGTSKPSMRPVREEGEGGDPQDNDEVPF